MKLIPFNIDKHYPELTSWLKDRGSHLPSITDTPKWGCIVSDKDQFVACGFLRQVEGGYAQIDGLSTNPRCSSEQRHRAQDLVINKLIKYAKSKGIKSLISNSQYTNTITRAERHGFQLVSHSLLVLDLRSL